MKTLRRIGHGIMYISIPVSILIYIWMFGAIADTVKSYF